MSADLAPPDPGSRTTLDLLVAEASRQLDICNACRYCEGLCAVFPALERRTLLDGGDISQIANLCHDCRACYGACMYTPPHEFAINVPKALSELRVLDYERYVWPPQVPKILRGWTGVFSGSVLSAVVVVIIALICSGPGSLIHFDGAAASPYDLIPYPVMLVLLLLPGVYSAVIFVLAGRKYWRSVGGSPGRCRMSAVVKAVGYAATLRYLRGGGQECYYPDEERPSSGRRHLHGLVAYGFGLCLVSTIAAAIQQDVLGQDPPYPLVSVPVIAGLLGGIGMTVGTIGLLLIKRNANGATSVRAMTIKDYGLLVGLAFLSISGLATFLVRSTAAFGIVFLVHLAAICLTFAVAPYGKFVHLIFRFMALVRDNLEIEREELDAAAKQAAPVGKG